MPQFTALEHGYSPQLQLPELVAAWNDRLGIITEHLDVPIGYGVLLGAKILAGLHSLQGGYRAPLHRIMQEKMEQYIESGRALNHRDSTPAGDSPFAAWSWPAFAAEAGLDNSDWRRATEWHDVSEPPDYSSGKIVTGDIVGYWIIEDIIATLKTARITLAPAGITDPGGGGNYRLVTNSLNFGVDSFCDALAGGIVRFYYRSGGVWTVAEQIRFERGDYTGISTAGRYPVSSIGIDNICTIFEFDWDWT